MSTYTDSLGLEEITPGDQAGLWGNTTNNNLALIDQAVTGVTPISFTGLSGTVRTLDAANGALDEARAAVLNITGTATGSNTVVVPNKQKTYLVRNSTGQTVNFRTASPAVGGTYPVEAGNSILIFCDGNNSVFTGIQSPSSGTLSVTGGGTGATTFTAGFIKSPGGTGELTSAATVALGSADVSGILPVVNGGTGAGTFSAGRILIGNGTSNFGVLSGSADGQVATWNAAGSTWTAATPATGAVTSVFGRTAAVTAQSSDYSAFYATLSSSNNFTGTNNYSTAASIQMSGSTIGDQRLQVSGGGFNSGLSGSGVQLGASGWGIIYGSAPDISILAGGSFSTAFRTSGNFQSNNSPNWATVSDINIKTNLRPISSALSKLNSLNPCHFEYKDALGKTQTGFIAQELATVFPGHTLKTSVAEKYKEFMPEGTTELLAIDMNLTAYVVKAIQELSAKVDAQAAEIAALKGA
jgi:hypothetical protein